MVRILEVKDKTGREIYLTDERYNHIKKHPEMQNSLNIIKETIENPQKTTDYSLDSDVKYYYRYYKYLNGKGFVITAYFVVGMT